MTREEINQFVQDVQANATDVGRLSELMETLREDYVTQLTTQETLNTSLEELNKNNESLRKVNNAFQLKLGDLSFVGDNTQQFKKEKEEIPSYDSLFNERGELK